MFKNFSLPAEVLSDDFMFLRKLIKTYPSFSSVGILGPSIAAMTASYRVEYFKR